MVALKMVHLVEAMAVVLQAGLRGVGPRVGRGAGSVNIPVFNDRDVDEGEALLDEHFQLRIHPDARVVRPARTSHRQLSSSD